MSSRDTPYDLIFGAPSFDEERLVLLREQDACRSTTPTDLFMLAAAGDLLRDLLPADDGAAPHAAVVSQVSSLMFHAYRFWLHGRHVYRFEVAALQPLLTGAAPAPEWRFRAPGPAGYVQFPRNAIWARVSVDAAPEPVDGFFWSAPVAAGERAARLDLLFALGMRRGRPGLSLVDATVDMPATLDEAAVSQARPDGVDFANVLPGGELQGYHALTTQAEAVRIAALCFWRIDTIPQPAPATEGGNEVRVLEHG
ncbi:MAG: hypothetical protein WD054_05295 [Gemmatimonadota bacterium]